MDITAVKHPLSVKTNTLPLTVYRTEHNIHLKWRSCWRAVLQSRVQKDSTKIWSHLFTHHQKLKKRDANGPPHGHGCNIDLWLTFSNGYVQFCDETQTH